MNKNLQQELVKNYGLTEEQIKGIEELGATSKADMQYVTADDLVELGLKVVIARRIVKAYSNFEVAATTAAPHQITVNMQKGYPDMRVNELFDALLADPSDDEALAELQSRDQYRAASSKTNKTAVVNADKTLNVAATTKYWQYLRTRGTNPQTRFQGLRTTTMEQALGRKEKMMYHPLFANEIIYMGVDSWANDWSQVDVEMMEAVYWGRTNNHQMFPRNPDPIDAFTELSQENPTRRWETMLEDYRAHKDDGGGVSVVMTEGGSPASGNPFRTHQW